MKLTSKIVLNSVTRERPASTLLAGSTDQWRKKLRGFTLVELLVVIAIIGVLVALLLPAIQAAREAARRNQCMSQIKQLALGCLNTHDTQKHFPTGGWGYGWVGDPDRGFGKGQPGGWVYNVLPFIEQQALHDLGSDGDPNTMTPQQMKGASDVLEQPISIINCPSRRSNTPWPMTVGMINTEDRRPSAVAGRSDYAMSSGTRMTETNGGPGSYAEAAAYKWTIENTTKPELLDGISYQISRVAIQQIADGTSQTLMIGEKFIRPSEYETGTFASDNETWCTGWNNDNFRIIYGVQTAIGSTTYNIDPPVPDTDDSVPSFTPQTPTANRFGSAHPSVWIAAYCDGSTHALSYDTDPEMLRRLASRHDGLTLDTSGL